MFWQFLLMMLCYIAKFCFNILPSLGFLRAQILRTLWISKLDAKAAKAARLRTMSCNVFHLYCSHCALLLKVCFSAASSEYSKPGH